MALRCDRCLVITTVWNLFAPFHSDNTVQLLENTSKLAETLLRSALATRAALWVR